MSHKSGIGAIIQMRVAPPVFHSHMNTIIWLITVLFPGYTILPILFTVGWRAVFALIIVLFHVGVAGFEEMTCAGVCFFFMVSGFLLRLKYPFKELDGGNYSRFVWRHALKLYPLHWLALALLLVAMALVGRLVIRPGVLALDVALLQSW